MKRSICIAIGLALAVFSLGSCTNEKIVAPVVPMAKVSGIVNAWRCDVDDWINNYGDVRYSVGTGLSATVKFVRVGDCCTTFGGTDDSSAYEIRTAKGEYYIVVETPYAHPDTFFGINLTADTTIDLDFVYEVQTPDTVTILCTYENADDTLDQSVERQYIGYFNQWIDDMLDIDAMTKRSYNLYSPTVYIEYRIPVRPEYAPWQVEEKAQDVWGAGMPDNMNFSTDTYICMD